MTYQGTSYRYDSPGDTCSGSASPGALALGKWSKARWSLPAVGIYNCRPSRNAADGATQVSTHGEGRGIDTHVHLGAAESLGTPSQNALLDLIAREMVAHALDLGVQRVIVRDVEWDSRPGQRQWNHYDGPFHGNHAHIELCRLAAFNLTLEDIERTFADRPTTRPRRRHTMSITAHPLEPTRLDEAAVGANSAVYHRTGTLAADGSLAVMWDGWEHLAGGAYAVDASWLADGSAYVITAHGLDHAPWQIVWRPGAGWGPWKATAGALLP